MDGMGPTRPISDPVVLWSCGPVVWVWYFNSDVQIGLIEAYSLMEGFRESLKEGLQRVHRL